jgi:serine/threonine-protein kinase
VLPPTRVEPSIPAPLEAVVMRCLAKNPANRYQSASDLAADLERFLAGRTVAATPVLPVGATEVIERGSGSPTAVYRATADRRTIRRRRVIAIIIGVLLLAALGIGLGVLANTLLQGNSQTATVPCIRGKSYEQTHVALQQAGFTQAPDIVQTPDDTIPAGSVVSCSPTGTQPVDATITVNVSSGASTKLVLVPSVFCLSTDSARSTLTKAGFRVQTGGNDRGSTCTTPGFVASQEPAAYSQQPFGSVVTLLLVPQPTTTPPPTTPSPTTPPPTTPSPTSPSPTSPSPTITISPPV